MSSSMGHESSGGADEEDSSGLQRVVWFRQMLHRWQSSSSSRSATASERRSSASASDDGDGDGDGANLDAATTDRNNDATPSAADNAASSRDPPLPPASNSVADDDDDDDDDDDRRRLPRVLVVEERIRRGEDAAAAAACESPMTPDAPPPADVPRGCCPVYVGAERRRFVVPTAYLGMPVFRRLLEKAEEEFEFHYHGGAVTIPCDTEAFNYILVVMDRHRQGLVDDGTLPLPRAAACESPMTPDAPPPADVPRGCCPVYVGAERRRFVVPTAYLGMPVFRRLLEKAEEEFEFHYHGGAVTIPCDTEAFKYILVVMDQHRQGLVDDGTLPPPRAAACESPMTLDAPPPADVPRGCCPVYVGAERRRFVVPTAYLGMPVFRRLLEKAEEEFEFHYHGGAVTIPCDTEAFKYILVVMDRHRQGLVDDDGNDKHGEQDASSSPQAR